MRSQHSVFVSPEPSMQTSRTHFGLESPDLWDRCTCSSTPSADGNQRLHTSYSFNVGVDVHDHDHDAFASKKPPGNLRYTCTPASLATAALWLLQDIGAGGHGPMPKRPRHSLVAMCMHCSVFCRVNDTSRKPPLLASPATLALVDHVVRIVQGPCNSEDPLNVWLHGAPGNGMSTLLRQAARVTEHVTPNMMAAYIPLVSGTECMLNVQHVALCLVQSRDMLTPAGMDFMHKSVPANVYLLCDTLARHRMTMTLYLDNAEALLSDKRFSGSIADYETTQANLEFVQQLMAAGGPVRCVMASSSTSAPLKFSGQWAAAAAAWPVRGGATFFLQVLHV